MATISAKGACLICCGDLTTISLGECEHAELCWCCAMRLRALYNDKRCPLCKATLDIVVFCDVQPDGTVPPFVSFNAVAGNPNLDKKLGILYASPTSRRNVDELSFYKCPACNEPATRNLPAMRAHLRTHGLTYCDTCLSDRKLFRVEQRAYAVADLPSHRDNGDANDPLSRPHRRCDFCRRYFFGDDELYEHMRVHHEQCFLCARAGRQFQYFRDYAAMEEHFGEEHFLCREPECLAAKFIVYPSEIDLRAHQVERHRHKMTRQQEQATRTLQLNFSFANGRTEVTTTHASNTPSQTQGGNQASRSRSQQTVLPTTTASVAAAPMVTQITNAATAEAAAAAAARAASMAVATQSVSDKPDLQGDTETEVDFNQLPQNLAPEEIQQRRKQLTRMLKDRLDGNAHQYSVFRNYSEQLLTGEISPERYFSEFQRMFGSNVDADALFLELITLLPDKDIQHSLFVLSRPKQPVVKKSGKRSVASVVAGVPDPDFEEHFPSLRDTLPAAPAPSAAPAAAAGARLGPSEFPSLPGKAKGGASAPAAAAASAASGKSRSASKTSLASLSSGSSSASAWGGSANRQLLVAPPTSVRPEPPPVYATDILAWEKQKKAEQETFQCFMCGQTIHIRDKGIHELSHGPKLRGATASRLPPGLGFSSTAYIPDIGSLPSSGSAASLLGDAAYDKPREVVKKVQTVSDAEARALRGETPAPVPQIQKSAPKQDAETFPSLPAPAKKPEEVRSASSKSKATARLPQRLPATAPAPASARPNAWGVQPPAPAAAAAAPAAQAAPSGSSFATVTKGKKQVLVWGS